MTTARKLLTILVFTGALFIVAFGTSFFAMKVAFADEHAEKGEHAAKPPEDQFFDNTKYFNWLGSPAEHHGKDVTGGAFGDGSMKSADGKVLYNRHPDNKGIYHPAEEEMSAPFIFMVLNFVLLLVVLAWKAKPAIEKLAADRHDQIKTAIDEAAKLRKQAQERLDEYASKLAKADAEIKAMVEGIRTDAEADKKRILEAADRQAVQLKKDADARIAAEIELARTSLTREVTYAATTAAEKLLREKMSPSDQQSVISEFITGVQAVARKEVR